MITANGLARAASIILAGLILGACGSAEGSGDADTDPNREDTLSEFCDAIEQIATQTDPAVVFAAYDALEASSPPEIADEVEAFVAVGREVGNAILAAGEDPTEAELREALAGVSQDAREMVEGLAAASKTGEAPAGPAGAVLSYGIDNCDIG